MDPIGKAGPVMGFSPVLLPNHARARRLHTRTHVPMVRIVATTSMAARTRDDIIIALFPDVVTASGLNTNLNLLALQNVSATTNKARMMPQSRR
jgi:hypothetical protein